MEIMPDQLRAARETSYSHYHLRKQLAATQTLLVFTFLHVFGDYLVACHGM